jgi:hypothetical protein
MTIMSSKSRSNSSSLDHLSLFCQIPEHLILLFLHAVYKHIRKGCGVNYWWYLSCWENPKFGDPFVNWAPGGGCGVGNPTISWCLTSEGSVFVTRAGIACWWALSGSSSTAVCWLSLTHKESGSIAGTGLSDSPDDNGPYHISHTVKTDLYVTVPLNAGKEKAFIESSSPDHWAKWLNTFGSMACIHLQGY